MMWGWYSLSGEIGLQHYLPLHVDWLQTKLRVKPVRFEWTTKISLLHTASWSIDGLLPCRWMQSHGLQEGNPFLNHLKTTKDQLQHFQLMEQVYTFCIFLQCMHALLIKDDWKNYCLPTTAALDSMILCTWFVWLGNQVPLCSDRAHERNLTDKMSVWCWAVFSFLMLRQVGNLKPPSLSCYVVF